MPQRQRLSMDEMRLIDRAIRERQQACQTYVSVQVTLEIRQNVQLFRCRDCYRWANQYHHPNYQYPDLVIPLCFSCHRRRHRDSPPSWDWLVEQLEWEGSIRATR